MNKEELEAVIRTVRRIISQNVNSIRNISCPEAGRELALSVTNFQLSAMWLGKLLGYLGSENPYPESRNPDSPIIEKHADTVTHYESVIGGDSIVNIKMLRSNFKELSKVVDEIDKEIRFNRDDNENASLAIIHSTKQLTEADMWLGMALGAIRDKAEATK